MDIEVTKREDERFDLYLGGERVGDFDTIDEAIHYAEAHGEKVENDGVRG